MRVNTFTRLNEELGTTYRAIADLRAEQNSLSERLTTLSKRIKAYESNADEIEAELQHMKKFRALMIRN